MNTTYMSVSIESKYQSQTWHELLRMMIEDPHEKQRIARDVRVSTVTLQRLASKATKPREENIRKLLKAIPHHYSQVFLQLIAKEFSDIIQEETTTVIASPELPAAFYARVLLAYANIPHSLRSQAIYDLILKQVVEHLDPNRQGLSVSVACCVPPLHGNKVRSLQKIRGMGTFPWEGNQEQHSIFLGAESLAGAAVHNYRMVSVLSRQENLSRFPVHWMEHEQSVIACPIFCETRIAGCLLVSSTQPNYFTEVHATLIERYANLMALAFEPDSFFDHKDIELRLMPQHSVQEIYFRNFKQRMVQKFLEALRMDQFIALYDAQVLVWQEIEEELIQCRLSDTLKLA